MSSERESSPSAHSAWRSVAVVSAVVAVVCAVCVKWPLMWDLLGVSHERPYFLDLVAVLAASDARAAGLDPYAIPSPLDPWGRPHVYGPWWLYLHKLGLGADDATWLGFLLVAATVCGLALALRPVGKAQTLVACLLVASPPLLLGYERGNNDLVVALLLLAAGLATRAGPVGLATRSALVLSAATLKFYPIAALPVLALGRRALPALAAIGGAAASGVVVWWIWRDDFVRAYDVVPRPHTLHGYGFKLLQLVWVAQNTWMQAASYAAPLLAAAGATMSFVVLGRRAGRVLETMSDPDSRAGAWFVGAGCCWVLCFFANSNFPYRAVLLVVVATAWFEMWRGADGEARAVGRRLAMLLAALLFLRLIRLWASVFSGADQMFLGRTLLGLEHGLALGLSLVVLAAILWRAGLTLQGWRRGSCT